MRKKESSSWAPKAPHPVLTADYKSLLPHAGSWGQGLGLTHVWAPGGLPGLAQSGHSEMCAERKSRSLFQLFLSPSLQGWVTGALPTQPMKFWGPQSTPEALGFLPRPLSLASSLLF